MSRGRRALAVALMVLSSMTAAACAGGGEPTEPAAQTATTPTIATPTPTIDVPGSNDNHVPPPVTRGPSDDVFDWVKFDDELSGTSVALPKDAEPVENAIPGPDGTTVPTRGHVFEHADGVIGFELIDDFATLDDLEKLTEFLADSVGGTVAVAEDVDTGRSRGIDGEISYGDDQVMLFRILVLNSDGDVWNGFVGGPVADRERLESEFARLTISANLRPAAGWVAVLDEPTGITVELPDRVEPEDQTSGEPSSERGYHHDDGVGFIVVEVDPGDHDLEGGLASLAESVEGAVESATPLEVRGRRALDGIVVTGEWTYLMRVIHLSEQVLIIYASGPSDDQERLANDVDRMTDTFVEPE